MTFDYSSAARPTRPTASRIVLIGALLVVISLAAFLLIDNGGEVTTPAVKAQQAGIDPALRPGHYDAIVNKAVDDALKNSVDANVVTASADNAAKAASAPAGPSAASGWKTFKIKRGQTLSTLFSACNLPADAWISIVKLGGDASRLKNLQVGQTLRMRTVNDRLQALTYAYDETHTLTIRRVDGGFKADTMVAQLEHHRAVASGTIHDSLFQAGERSGLSDQQIMQFAHILNYDVDFTQDLQPGDRFTVVYNEIYKDGKKLRNGDILAAELITQGHDYRAIRYTRKDGETAYYTPKGLSLKRQFIRTPVDFTRISSGFSHARLNPVLHIVRPHYGTDYAAPMGTPVHVTSDGRVEFIGRDGGYGNCIKVRHGAHYETIYGHLSHFHKGLRRGSHVKQGEVIGYVGMTGLATGPHLHYEFRVDGIPKNPLTVKLPHGLPLPAKLMPNFHKDAAPLMAALSAADTSQYADVGPTIGTR